MQTLFVRRDDFRVAGLQGVQIIPRGQFRFRAGVIYLLGAESVYLVVSGIRLSGGSFHFLKAAVAFRFQSVEFLLAGTGLLRIHISRTSFQIVVLEFHHFFVERVILLLQRGEIILAAPLALVLLPALLGAESA